MKNKIIISALVVLIVAIVYVIFQGPVQKSSLGLAVCTVTESKVSVGDDIATTILNAGARSWALVQQPANATNTVSVSFGGTAVLGSGYTLDTASSSELVLGFATDLPTSVALSAVTSTGSSTLNVIECR